MRKKRGGLPQLASLVCLAPSSTGQGGGWEQEGAESLALRPRSSCAHTHGKDSPPPSGLGWGEGQARLLQECGPVSRRGPPRISYKSSGRTGNQLWVATWALHPDGPCPHLHNGDNKRPSALLVRKGVLRTAATTEHGISHRRGWSRARGWWESEQKTGAEPGKGPRCSQGPDRMEAVDSASPSFIGPVPSVKPPARGTAGPANGKGGQCLEPFRGKGLQHAPSPTHARCPGAWEERGRWLFGGVGGGMWTR